MRSMVEGAAAMRPRASPSVKGEVAIDRKVADGGRGHNAGQRSA
jgi:hypothetical protein